MNGMIDETELARLEEGARAASKGKWVGNIMGEVLRHGGEKPVLIAECKNPHPLDLESGHKVINALYIAAACNAVPALIAEIRRLREALNKEHRAWQCAEGRGDGLEMENTALREKVEAWEWFEECFEVMQWLVPMGPNRADGCTEAVMSTLHAQKRAVHVDR